MSVVAKALVFDKAGHVLVLRRSSTHPRYAFHPDFPGGIVEDHESHHEGVQREIREETGLIVLSEHLELVHQKQTPKGSLYIVYTAHLPQHKPAVEISWEHDKFEWIPLDTFKDAALPDGVDDYHLTVLEYLQTR